MLAFDQIVAEQSVIGKALARSQFKNRDIIDAFTGERRSSVQVLINVRNRGRIRIITDLPTVDPCQARFNRRLNADADAWLQQTKAFAYDLLFEIDDSAV